MNFGQALEALKKGEKVYRQGWNGKGMFLFLVPGSTFNVSRPPLLGIYPEGTEVKYHAHVDMKTATGEVVPWLCSQTDMLAEDWAVSSVKPEEPKTFNCPSRGERPAGLFPFMDHWYISDNHATCSYCGSLHPDTFMDQAAVGCEVIPTDKNYKAYIMLPDKGQTKFYFEHLSEGQRVEFVQLYNEKKLKLAAPGRFYRLPFFMKVLDA